MDLEFVKHSGDTSVMKGFCLAWNLWASRILIICPETESFYKSKRSTFGKFHLSQKDSSGKQAVVRNPTPRLWEYLRQRPKDVVLCKVCKHHLS